MRDPYNRKQRLTYWIRRIEGDLDGTDREDVKTFVNHMKYNANSALWILRSITALISMRKMIGTPFRDCTSKDIRKFIDLRKFFYKAVYGKNEFYPEQVKWFSIKVSKDKIRESFVLDNAEHLEEEEIKVVIARASSVQRKAFISCMFSVRLLVFN